MSTAEIEATLVKDGLCVECAVVGIPDDLTGQSMVCFCIVQGSDLDESSIQQLLRQQVRNHIGAFAMPKRVVIVDDLPKTR